jgi:hypothetical protein
MTTAALFIAESVRTALAGLAGGRVYLNRLRPLPAGQNTGIVVRLEQSAGRALPGGTMDWATMLRIECIARGTPGADPAAAADDLLAAVWAIVVGLSVTALHAMAVALDPQIDWQYDDAEAPYVSALLSVRVLHFTPYNALTSA